MANLRLGVAFGVLTLTLLVFVQLLAALQNGDETPVSSFSRSFNQWNNRANAANAANSNLFLVGAGKADVTGYVFQWP
jgi:neutral ceramidase